MNMTSDSKSSGVPALLLGIDIGTSSTKVSVIDAATTQCIASAHYPETEAPITSIKEGWAEQSPEMWWQNTIQEFELPVELLFKAYVEPEIVEQWMGTKVLKLENKRHGGYQFETSDPQGNVVFKANGVI